MLSIVVLAIASETGLGISVWGFIVSVQGGSLMDALAAVILFIASALAMFLSYELVDQRARSAEHRQQGQQGQQAGHHVGARPVRDVQDSALTRAVDHDADRAR